MVQLFVKLLFVSVCDGSLVSRYRKEECSGTLFYLSDIK